MKKLITTLCLLSMFLSLFAPVGALANTKQVHQDGGTVFYNASGEKVTAANTQLGTNGAIVQMSKTIADVPNLENAFDITLQVRTTQDIVKLSSDSPDAAVTLILDISSSMRNDCVSCGHTSGNSCHTRGNCTFYSRLNATIDAAKAFVADYASMGMNADTESSPKRLVSILSFDLHAYTNTAEDGYYVDVATANGLNTINARLEALRYASSSGTNIESGLRLGRNVQLAAFADGKPYDYIDYLYTILLTDGEPTRGLTNDDAAGTGTLEGYDPSDKSEYIDTIGPNATDIKNLSNQARIFSICLGAEGDGSNPKTTMGLTPFTSSSYYDGKNNPNPAVSTTTTIGAWLGMFSNGGVYGDSESSSAASILDTFETIFQQMSLAAEAWEVRDEMGPYIDYLIPNPLSSAGNEISVNNDVLTWNLLASTMNSSLTDENANPPVYGYSYTYRVKLDNLPEAYSGQASGGVGPATPSNTSAVLDYAVEDTDTHMYALHKNKPFDRPEVFGFTGSLSFMKLNNANPADAVEGITFSLYEENGTHPIATDTSDSSGMIEFINIPSGHSYRLVETADERYYNLPDITFDVNYGQAENFGGPIDTTAETYTVTNQINEHEGNTIDLEIIKKIKVLYNGVEYDLPQNVLHSEVSALFHIHHGASEEYRTVHLYQNSSEKNLSETLLNISDEPHIIEEKGYSLSNCDLSRTDIEWAVKLIDANGQESPDTQLTDDEVMINDTAVTINPDRDEVKKVYTVTYTNVFEPHLGSISVTKAFHSHLLNGAGKKQFTDGLENVSVKLNLYSASSNTLITTAELSHEKGWTATFDNLPIGRYLIKEEAPKGGIAGHEWVRGMFIHNGNEHEAVSLGYVLDVKKDGKYDLLLENHYDPHHAHIRVDKLFTFDQLPDGMTAAEYFIALYQSAAGANTVPRILVNIEDANGRLVDTLELDEDSGWADVSVYLAPGTYTLIERAADFEPTAEGSVPLAGFIHQELHKNMSPTGRITNSQTVTLTADMHTKTVAHFIENRYTQDPDVSVPQTGDHSALSIWLLAFACSGTVLLFMHKRKAMDN